VSAVFYLNNKEAKRELNVNHNNEILPFCTEPKYLGVLLDRSLTHHRRLESLRKMLTYITRRTLEVACWFRLGCWSNNVAKTHPIAQVHSTTEYCALVWWRSAHTRLNDLAIKDALRIVTGCLRPTPADNLPCLADAQPTELRRKGATLSLSRRAMAPEHLLHCSPVHRVRMHGASNRDTHLYPPHNNSSIQLTTTSVRRCEPITNGMRSG